MYGTKSLVRKERVLSPYSEKKAAITRLKMIHWEKNNDCEWFGQEGRRQLLSPSVAIRPPRTQKEVRFGPARSHTRIQSWCSKNAPVPFPYSITHYFARQIFGQIFRSYAMLIRCKGISPSSLFEIEGMFVFTLWHHLDWSNCQRRRMNFCPDFFPSKEKCVQEQFSVHKESFS